MTDTPDTREGALPAEIRACPSCDRPAQPGEVFCPACGSRLLPEAAPGPERRRARGLVAAAVAGIVVIGAGIAFLLVVLSSEEAASCGPVLTEPSQGALHLRPGEPYDPPTRPATSGLHHAIPLPPEPRVHAVPINEARAVHNLEHAYVLVYYREGGLGDEVLETLRRIAQGEHKVIMAPYPDLPEGAGLALVAWTRIQTCPPVVGAEEAEEAAREFIARFRGTSNAPEPRGP